MLAALPLALALVPTPSDIAVGPGSSIQAAIDAAVNGDRILIAPGTYVGPLSFQGKAIELIGTGGPQVTTISAGGVGPVVSFHHGEGTSSVLRGFTITNGSVSSSMTSPGGGISCVDLVASPVSTTPLVQDCIVRGNTSYRGGGGVGGNPVLERCVFAQNFAMQHDGGGVWGAPTLRRCIVAENLASDGYGGGLFLTGGAAIVEDTLIVCNVSYQSAKGGGVYAADGFAGFVRCTIARNYADGYFLVAAAPTCDAALEFSPPALYAGRGGAIHVAGATVALDRCTVVENVGTHEAIGPNPGSGGIHGAVVMTNSILRDNEPPESHLLDAGISYSDVEGGAAGAGVIDTPAMFVDAPGEDWHLAPSSPCIDAGDPAAVDPDGTRADMGAHWFRTMYTVDRVQSGSWFDPSWPVGSLQTGGKQVLRILGDAGAANLLYVTAGTASGTSPGLALLGLLVPLNPDAYLSYTVANPNHPPLSASLGFLDGSGSGHTTLWLPAGSDPALAGITLHHAAAIVQLSPALAGYAATTAEPFLLAP